MPRPFAAALLALACLEQAQAFECLPPEVAAIPAAINAVATRLPSNGVHFSYALTLTGVTAAWWCPTTWGHLLNVFVARHSAVAADWATRIDCFGVKPDDSADLKQLCAEARALGRADAPPAMWVAHGDWPPGATYHVAYLVPATADGQAPMFSATPYTLPSAGLTCDCITAHWQGVVPGASSSSVWCPAAGVTYADRSRPFTQCERP